MPMSAAAKEVAHEMFLAFARDRFNSADREIACAADGQSMGSGIHDSDKPASSASEDKVTKDDRDQDAGADISMNLTKRIEELKEK